MFSNSFCHLEHLSKYMVKVTKYDNIEDCPDDFMTIEQAHVLLGEKYGGSCVPRGRNVLVSLLKADLLELKERAIQKGMKKFVISDEMVEAISHYYHFSELLPFARRRKNTIYLNDEQQEQAKIDQKLLQKRNRQYIDQMIYSCLRSFNSDHKFELKINHIRYDLKGTLKFMQQFVTWEQFVEVQQKQSPNSWIAVDDMEYALTIWNELDHIVI